MMKRVMVRYKVKPYRAAENEALIDAPATESTARRGGVASRPAQ
jgi:hypothetical protein